MTRWLVLLCLSAFTGLLVSSCQIPLFMPTPERGDALESIDIVSTALVPVPEPTPTPRGLVLEVATPDNVESAQRTAYAKLPRSSTSDTELAWVHIDGTIEDGSTLSVINIWDDYQTRASVVCRVSHGERVQMGRRSSDGNGVFIVCPSGKTGWVSYWFVKELK